jgi:putative membrane protein
MFYMHELGWGWWMVMSVGMVAFWALVVYGIVWLLRSGQNTQQRAEPAPDKPADILKRRLARGEISIDEYERLHKTIEDEPSESVAA